MDAALIGSAWLLGLAGAPHCAAMCAAPCAAVAGGKGASAWAFQGARAISYALAGAIAAASVGALAALASLGPSLRPLWALLHALLLALGLWMLWRGRQPDWLARLGRQPDLGRVQGWQSLSEPLRAAAAGSVWVAWPCGLLHSALLVASLTSSPAAGGAAMLGFALASAPGLLAAPWIWQRLGSGREGLEGGRRWLVRWAGALLVLASGFALGHGVWAEIAAYCGWT